MDTNSDGHDSDCKAMEYDDEDPWARKTPVDEKGDVLAESPDPVHIALPASASTGSIVHKDVDGDDNEDSRQGLPDNDDSEAWNADSDAEEANGDAFVEATSRMSLSASFVSESQDTQESIQGFADPQPIAGPSTFPSAFESTGSPSGPPLDDFDEDDGFGDFGEPAVGTTDDDDDFGAFDEAGNEAQDASFSFDEDEHGQASTAVPTSQTTAHPPSQGEAHSFGPPCDIDFESIYKDEEALKSAILGHFEKAYPNLYAGIDTSPATRQAWNKIDMTLEPEEILLGDNPGAKRLLDQCLDPRTFPYKPWEWKRSQIRIHAMREKGIPVNLDDFAPPTKMQPLRLPSIRTTAASPIKDKSPLASTSSGRRSGANSRSTSPSRLGRGGATNSSPASPISSSRSPTRQNSQAVIPPLDKEECERLANMSEVDMAMKAIGELEILQNDLQASAIEASQHLTALLEQKETLTGQNQTYNAMISDLVAQAQKLRSSASPSGISRKTSIRRSDASSKPPSRPASPAGGNPSLKSSVGRSSAGQSTGAGKDPSRRSSLW